MPELPEVETIVRALQKGGRNGFALPGRKILDVQVFWDRTIQLLDVNTFKHQTIGQQIMAVNRRGKFVVISLEGGFLLIHLRMSGDLRAEAVLDEQKQPIAPGRFDRVIFLLDDGLRLAFEDTRKFGCIWFLQDPSPVLSRLGPEPFDPEFTVEIFARLLKQHRRQVKPLLMDQGFIAGLGNIYTDEALHIAGVHPLQLSDRLDAVSASRLYNAIRQVLQTGIQENGASIDWVYKGGNFQNKFQVYQRSGEACYTCGTTIERIVVGQRGTHFCPVCQQRDE